MDWAEYIARTARLGDVQAAVDRHRARLQRIGALMVRRDNGDLDPDAWARALAALNDDLDARPTP